MARLTKQELRIINRALALYETTENDAYPDEFDESPEADQTRDRLDAYWAAVAETRRKIHARIGGDYQDDLEEE